MIAGIYNITCEQGSTFLRIFEIEQPNLIADPTGNTFEDYDLSGHSARMQIRRTIDSDTTIVNMNSSSASAPGRIEVNPGSANNQIQVFMSDAVTASITTSGVYDLEVIAANGFVSKVIRGAFTLIPEVTK